MSGFEQLKIEKFHARKAVEMHINQLVHCF